MLTLIYLLASLVVFFVIGCAQVDPGETVNHLHLGRFILDLTVGPIATIIVFPFILWGVQVIIKRQLDKRDREAKEATEQENFAKAKKEAELEAAKREAIQLKTKIERERHQALIDIITENRHLVVLQVDKVCKQLKDQDSQFRNHGHNVDSNSGKTTDIIIKLDI